MLNKIIIQDQRQTAKHEITDSDIHMGQYRNWRKITKSELKVTSGYKLLGEKNTIFSPVGTKWKALSWGI